MSSIMQAIRSHLLTKTAVTDLVGTRIYPLWRPQDGAKPAITLQRVSEQHVHDLEGSSGLAQPRIQVDCWANSYAVAETLGEAVRTALQGFTGTVGGVTIFGSELGNRQDMSEPPTDGTDKWVYRVLLDLDMIYGESIPT